MSEKNDQVVVGFYDNEVKRVCEKTPRLLVMAINSIFNKNHDVNGTIKFLDKELSVDSRSNPQFLDKLIEIEGIIYHLEFQLLEDKMAIRMYEYAVKETIRTLPDDADKYEIDVVMPHQAVIFLAGANKKTEITVNLTLPDEQKVSYMIRCISASDTVDFLCKEELYILLPFQQVQLNDRMLRLNKNSTDKTRRRFAKELYDYRQAVISRLEKLLEDDIIKPHEKEILLEITGNIENYLRDKDAAVDEEVEIMGDENYIAWSDRLRMEGRESGLEEGRKSGLEEGRKSGLEEGGLINLLNTIIKKVKKQKPLELIADETEEDLDYIRPMYDAIIANPSKSAEEIYAILQNME